MVVRKARRCARRAAWMSFRVTTSPACASLTPTVSRGVTYAVVCTYGCDSGRISPTRCVRIDAGLDGRYRLHRSYKTPPAVAGSAHVGLAAASRLASPADRDVFPRSRTTPPSAITPCGDATPAKYALDTHPCRPRLCLV